MALRSWLKEHSGGPDAPVLHNRAGGRLSHDGLGYILAKDLAVARKTCPALSGKRVPPHVLRHTAAMEPLQNGVDRAVIALWLGHERVETTYIYLHANLELKRAAMAKTSPAEGVPEQCEPEGSVLAFLNSL